MNLLYFFRNHNETTFLAIVNSRPKNFDARQAIRSTWGNDFNKIHQIGILKLIILADMRASYVWEIHGSVGVPKVCFL